MGCNKRWVDGRAGKGKKATPEYDAWTGLRVRCDNPNHPFYYRYGGRGIKYCQRWDSFDLFFEDMGLKPGSDYSLDRINNDGNYEPENCRWATRHQQANNMSNNVELEHDGITLNLKQWADKTGLNSATIGGRLGRGWTIQEALNRSIKDFNQYITYKGKTKTLHQWAEIKKIKYTCLKDRLNTYGWTIKRAMETPMRSYRGK